MIPLRLVIDTNVAVSAALKPDGLQRTVVLLAITKPARLYVSEAIVAEYREVLSRRELRIRKGLQQQILQLIENRAYSVAPSCPLDIATIRTTIYSLNAPTPHAPTTSSPEISGTSQSSGRRPRSSHPASSSVSRRRIS